MKIPSKYLKNYNLYSICLIPKNKQEIWRNLRIRREGILLEQNAYLENKKKTSYSRSLINRKLTRLDKRAAREISINPTWAGSFAEIACFRGATWPTVLSRSVRDVEESC